MNILIDTDVLIDVALNREPHVRYSAQIMDAAQDRRFKSFIAWHSIANFYYLVSSPKTDKAAREFIGDLLKFGNCSGIFDRINRMHRIKMMISPYPVNQGHLSNIPSSQRQIHGV